MSAAFLEALETGLRAAAEHLYAEGKIDLEDRDALQKFSEKAWKIDRLARACIRFKWLRDSGEMGANKEKRLKRLELETGIHIESLRIAIGQKDWHVNLRVNEIEKENNLPI